MSKSLALLLLVSPVLLSAGLLLNDDVSTPASAPVAQGPPPLLPEDRVFDPQSIVNSKRVWLDVEVLLWQASEDGLDYAVKSSAQDHVDDGKVKSPDFEWDWGVQAGLGIKLPHDQWDLFFNYTYVQARAHSSVSAPDGGAVFPVFEAPFGLPDNFFADHARFRWKANLNIGDIELGRNCLISRWLSIRPFFGVRGLTIDQEGHIEYEGGTAAPGGDEDLVKLMNNFWGVGLRVGLNTLWGLGKGIGIYGNGAASLVSGSFDVEEKERFKSTRQNRLDVSADTDSVTAIAEIALGLQWDRFFSQNRYHFGVKLGWELNVFFDQNNLVRFLNSTNPGAISRNNGDLTFQGLTLGFRLDF
ncbi:MAG TPA: Lpg1974 family pore-forming outer membrane protein [Rhabdochlamydiaceae bacterium]|jgi:hypothetical protein